jgi:DedD protein
MSDPNDANLQLKKRARRRLVGAIAFAGLAAVVLPMVMDEEPKQQIQDVQIRIPGQDQTPFNPKVAKPATPAVVSEKAETPEKTTVLQEPPRVAEPAEVPVAKPADKATDKPVEKKTDKPTEKKTEKPAEKSTAKAAEKPAEKPAKANDKESQRAAAILAGKTVEAASSAPATNGGGQYVILIGAFSNPGNVKQLQSKIGELGIKVFTESLDAPEGKKTRVRAGPFPNREAADKALDKMKRIGVNGVVAAKQ